MLNLIEGWQCKLIVYAVKIILWVIGCVAQLWDGYPKTFCNHMKATICDKKKKNCGMTVVNVG